jgi:predicted GNAT family N-acyltransferase
VAERAAPVRVTVFVHEQGVPADLECDAFDAVSRHALALDAQGRPIGTGRLLPDGHIGRMAVLQAWRGRGVGAALLLRLLQAAREDGVQRVALNAQVRAVGFYSRYGFAPEGAEFFEAGIAHLAMVRHLP